MKHADSNLIVGYPSSSQDIRVFSDGSTRARVLLRSAAIGFGTYKPGWRWSLHAGGQTGKTSAGHIGYVVSGRMMVRDSTGNEIEVGPGAAFEVGPDHDAWVVGGTPCVALDFIPSGGVSDAQTIE